jgi:cell shape-determining protein MreC
MKLVGAELSARVGEQVVTSGLDGCFPPGCWIGEVLSVERLNNLEWELIVRPACDFRALEAVQVLRTAQNEFPWPAPPAKGKR